MAVECVPLGKNATRPRNASVGCRGRMELELLLALRLWSVCALMSGISNAAEGR